MEEEAEIECGSVGESIGGREKIFSVYVCVCIGGNCLYKFN